MTLTSEQRIGVVLLVAGVLFALLSGLVPAVQVAGGTGYGGPTGSVGFSLPSSAPWVGVAIAVLGAVLLVVGRPPEGNATVVVHEEPA